MDQNPAMKLGLAFAALVGIWVTVYWMWEPSGPTGPSISFAADPGDIDGRGDGTSDATGRDARTGPERGAGTASGTKGSGAGSGGPLELRQGGGRQQQGGTTPSGASQGVRPPNQLPDAGKKQDDVKQPAGGSTPGTGPAPANGAGGPSMQVTPPKFEQYKVQAGDSFESIAKKRYGASSMHTVIARANPFIDPRRLRPGRVILIPLDPQNIQGKASPSADASREGWKTHTIVSGDTLSQISSKYYGTSVHSKRIYEANTDRLKNQNDLKLGMELLIPPLPKDEGGKKDGAGEEGR
jgi:nucleoid-associated protein YgaU